MRLAWVTPSSPTLSRSLHLYSSHLCLFYLLWSFSPPFPSSPSVSSPSSLSPPNSSLAKAEKGDPLVVTREEGKGCRDERYRESGREACLAVGETLAGGGGGRGESIEGKQAGGTPPLTPTFDVFSSASLSSTADDAGATSMPVRGGTSRRPTSSLEEAKGEKTPPLSPAPERSSSPSSSPPPSSIPRDPNPVLNPTSPQPFTITFTPLTFTLLLLHLLLLLRALTLSLADALSQRLLLAPPLHTIFSTPSSSAPSKPTTKPTLTVKKRLLLLRFQAREILRAAGPPGVAAFVLMVGVVGVVGWATSFGSSALAGREGQDLELVGWNAVPLSALFSSSSSPPSSDGGRFGLHVRLAEGYGATREAARFFGRRLGAGGMEVGGPWRWVVSLELLSLLLTLLHSLTPLLLSLRLLPLILPTPTFLLPSPSSPPTPPTLLLIPSPRLLKLALDLSLPLLSLSQSLVLLLARPLPPSEPAWRRWLSFSTLVLVNAVVSPVDRAVVSRERASGEVERVGKVVEAFGEREEKDGEEKGENEGRDKEKGEVGEWICTICFEGVHPGEAEAARQSYGGRGKGGKGQLERVVVATWWTRCRLSCRHVFHSSCLSSWFATQAFCPTCHRDARLPPTSPPPASSSHSSAPSAPTNAPRLVRTIDIPLPLPFDPPPPPPQPDYDSFPGAAAAAARRARGEGRRRVVMAGAGEEEVREVEEAVREFREFREGAREGW